MPVYEYECEACEQRTESIRAMRDADHPIACGHCGSDRTRRVHSVFAPGASSRAAEGARPGSCRNCPNAAGPCSFA